MRVWQTPFLELHDFDVRHQATKHPLDVQIVVDLVQLLHEDPIDQVRPFVGSLSRQQRTLKYCKKLQYAYRNTKY
jgi:hypothetical protein